MRQRTVACTPESSNDSPSPSPSPPPTPAPQPAPTPSPPDPKAEVEKVKSLRLEEDLKPGLTADEAVVEKKYKARKDAIDKALAAAGSTSSYGQKLARDLAKSRDDVVKTRDEAANPALRDDILKAIAEVAATKKNLADEETAFRRFDDVFAGKDVAAALSGSGFTAPDLKALVSQESGDLLKKHESDATGNIQGIAQLGKSAAEAVGADPADRTDPAKAIVIAAKYLAHLAGLAKKSLSPLPTGEDFKKFVIASYNAGPKTIQTAQQKAIAQSRSGATWSDIVDPAKGKGNDTAPLYKAWAEMKASVQGLGKIDVAQKYGETKGYVERIYRRLGK
jgi:soluble lytic murein transglycosylase-like protein